MTSIVVLGSINMDLVVKTDLVPRAGETIKGAVFKAIPGGKGANQAVAARRMGAEVRMVGAVGRDAFGSELKQSLAEAGVDVSCVMEKGDVSTGTATIIVDSEGNNRIIIVPGANDCLSCEDVDGVEDLIAKASMILMQFEIPFETIDHAVKMAGRYSVPVVLNPAPAYAVSDEFLSGVNYLIVNETEAEILSGIAVHDADSAKKAAEDLQTRGVETVIVTLGEQGAILLTAAGFLHIPARKVKVVDTTAAGDTFTGAFVVAVSEGMSLEDAARIAVSAGTLAVTRFGAQPSIPDREELNAVAQRLSRYQ
ncbi:MAG: ribokinase [Anaerolineales bacterium]|nr:ribokinase [Anaerolineales bacterium]